jgi:hypothetical protein
MRIAAGLLGFLLLVTAVPVRAAEGNKTPLGPPKQTTVVRGTPPKDLVGRWMAVGWIEVPDKTTRSTASLWEIREQNGALTLEVRFANLPTAQVDALGVANTQQKPWHPSPADLASIAQAWDQLTPGDPRILTVENEIVGRDGFDQAFKTEAKTKDALWAIRQVERFDPSAGGAMQTINVYGVLEARDGGYFGNFTTATIVAAPLPIPITLNGTFQMYRLGPEQSSAAGGGFVSRLLDAFRGCGR